MSLRPPLFTGTDESTSGVGDSPSPRGGTGVAVVGDLTSLKLLSASTVSDAQLGLTGLPVHPVSSEAVLGERGGEPLRFG